jgi:hypothetical protein
LYNTTLAAYPNAPNPNQLKFIVVLSASTSNSFRRFTLESNLNAAFLNLLGFFRGLDGEYLPSEVTDFKEVTPSAHCDSKHFFELHSLSEELLNKLGDSDGLAKNPGNTWIDVYSLSFLRNSNTWRACTNYLDSLVSSKSKTETQEIVQCPYIESDLEYADDPCCSRKAAWETPCVATPGEVEVPSVNNIQLYP